MRFLLDLVYLVVCVLLSPWILYRSCTAGRRDFALRFGVGLRDSTRPCIWLHGSSVGEVTVLKPLVATLEREHPGVPLVISAFTATGVAAARKLYASHQVVPLPADLSFVVARFLARLKPRLLVIAESEFWPNLIGRTHDRGIPVALVNGKMSAKSFALHTRTRLVASVLAKFAVLAMQTEEHATRLRQLGVAPGRLHVTGNMKYDLTTTGGGALGPALRAELGYEPTDVVVVGGSLHDGEDEALLDAYAAARAAVREAALVIVPRYPAEAETVLARARARGFAAVRKTAVDSGAATAPGRSGVLVVDTLGELSRLYAAADLAFVGGSLFFRGANKGGHNLMEPAVLGVPVMFGPYNFSFKETVDDLLAADAGKLVRDAAELRASVVALVADGAARRALGQRGQRVIEAGRGATARNYALLAQSLRVPFPSIASRRP
jgi:3-deoxy-D-manno-octulosonic-acid transferase